MALYRVTYKIDPAMAGALSGLTFVDVYEHPVGLSPERIPPELAKLSEWKYRKIQGVERSG
jgi:hypothetical protein